jgi:S1-C subfamily serine protease
MIKVLIRCALLFSSSLAAGHVWHQASEQSFGLEALVEMVSGQERSWRSSVGQMSNAVIQLRVCNLHFDWLQPFRSPSNSYTVGTAFFIHEDGYLVSNAHVVKNADLIHATIPAFGEELFEVTVLGMYPALDISLLKIEKKGHERLVNRFGAVPLLYLGDSDTLEATEELWVMGYPMGASKLKCTQGIFAGREYDMGDSLLHVTNPINPGNSGGPVIKKSTGEVIGVVRSKRVGTDIIGYAIPINNVKNILDYLLEQKIFYRPELYVRGNFGSDGLRAMLQNPAPGGCYLASLSECSLLRKAGLLPGDMLYQLEVEGKEYSVDFYGQTRVSWSVEPVPLFELFGRLPVGCHIGYVAYRAGERLEGCFDLSVNRLPYVRTKYPLFEEIDYEVFGGLVMMELTKNHISLFGQYRPELSTLADEFKENLRSYVIVTHIFAGSPAHQERAFAPGDIVKSINGKEIYSLNDVREALLAAENQAYIPFVEQHQNKLMALSVEKVCQQEPLFAKRYGYSLSSVVTFLQQKTC